MPSILEDLLNPGLVDPAVKIQVKHVYSNNLVDPSSKQLASRTKSIGPAKSLLEFYELVGKAISHYEIRAGTTEENKIVYTEEEPDIAAKTETITYSLISREPGSFSQGAPLEGRVKNQRPMFREEADDPEEPGYKQMILGYWHDNTVRFTCWARTNKAANKRAEWFENLMEEYSWWYKLQGVERVISLGQRADIVANVQKNKWYGRPFDFFVRTETLRVLKEKTIENVLVNLKVTNE
jgi:hypothetical protein